MKSTAALALALGLASFTLPNTGYAIGLEQKGQPTAVNALPTYGMEVPIRTALKTVIPSGWQLFVHHSAKLPKAVSWQPGDPWPHVLASMAIQANLAVLLDWDARTVLVRTEDIAVQEKATRAEIAQAAITPLPKFEVAQPRPAPQSPAAAPAEPAAPTTPVDQQTSVRAASSGLVPPAPAMSAPAPAPLPLRPLAAPSGPVLAIAPAPVLAEVVPTRPVTARVEPLPVTAQAGPVSPAQPTPLQSVRAARTPVIRTNPTPLMVAAQEAASAKKPTTLASTDKFSYVAPTALNKASVRRVAQGIANRYGLRLVWAAPEVALRGPVTMLSNSAAEDLYLLKKALGPSELEFQLSEADQSLQVRRKGDLRPRSSLAADAAAGHPVARDAVAALPPQVNSTRAIETVSSEPVVPVPAPAVTQAAAPLFSFSVAQDEPLENALLRFLRAQGYTYEWKVAGGFEAARPMTFEGSSLVQVLSQVLPPLGVSADVYTNDKHIVVRPGDALDK